MISACEAVDSRAGGSAATSGTTAPTMMFDPFPDTSALDFMGSSEACVGNCRSSSWLWAISPSLLPDLDTDCSALTAVLGTSSFVWLSSSVDTSEIVSSSDVFVDSLFESMESVEVDIVTDEFDNGAILTTIELRRKGL